MSYSIHRDDLPKERILKPEVVQNLLDLYTELLNKKGKINLSIKIVMALAITLTVGLAACKLPGSDKDDVGPATVYAATTGGLSISDDGGASFSNKTASEGLGSDNLSGVYVVP